MLRDVYIESSSTIKDSSTGDRITSDWYCNSEFRLWFATSQPMSSPGGEKYIVDAEDGDFVYVLYILYGTGDSFGSSTGNGEVIWTFTDIQQAIEAARAWNNNRKSEMVVFETQFGPLRLSNPGYDWFSNIEEIHVVQMMIDGVMIESTSEPRCIDIDWEHSYPVEPT
jgi:hypothetical protein